MHTWIHTGRLGPQHVGQGRYTYMHTYDAYIRCIHSHIHTYIHTYRAIGAVVCGSGVVVCGTELILTDSRGRSMRVRADGAHPDRFRQALVNSVCIHTFVCVCIYTYMYACTLPYLFIHVYVHVCMCHTYIRTYIHTYIPTATGGRDRVV